MLNEQKELYFYTKDRFEEELSRISSTCVSPVIAVRQVVKKAIDKYISDHCSVETKAEDIFSQEDFHAVSNKIHNEIVNS